MSRLTLFFDFYRLLWVGLLEITTLFLTKRYDIPYLLVDASKCFSPHQVRLERSRLLEILLVTNRYTPYFFIRRPVVELSITMVGLLLSVLVPFPSSFVFLSTMSHNQSKTLTDRLHSNRPICKPDGVNSYSGNFCLWYRMSSNTETTKCPMDRLTTDSNIVYKILPLESTRSSPARLGGF